MNAFALSGWRRLPAAFRRSMEERAPGLRARGGRWRLALERWQSDHRAPPRRERVLATVCWNFPIYSQTFVYEELLQLQHAGFDLRLAYAVLESRAQLPAAYASLWEVKRPTFIEPRTASLDFHHYARRMPERVDALMRRLGQASGFSMEQLTADAHFLMAFSYARLVEAYRPDYLHSYFFYEGTLNTMVASQLLGIPRGVSCYADHMLQDFPLKLVPLHLQTADVVVATSARIREELLAMHPSPESGNVLVKPNAIDTERFPCRTRAEPAPGAPYQVVCVARHEPKKGLLDLIEATRLVLDRGIPVELHLIGSEDQSPAGREYAARLQTRVDELRLRSVVSIDGWRSPEEVLGFLGQAHVFAAPFVELSTGDKDGIPTALLEAMSTGATILTTDAGSISEPMRPGVNGIVVEQRNPAVLADALVSLLRNPADRQRLGVNAARTVREEYDVRHCDRHLHERIRRVLAERRGAAP